MKAKTTPLFFLQDFAVKTKSSLLSVALIMMMLFSISNDVFAQPFPNGRTIVSTQGTNGFFSAVGNSYKGITPFNGETRSARMQYLFSDNDFIENEGATLATGDKITILSFKLGGLFPITNFSNITIRLGYTTEGDWNKKSQARVQQSTANLVDVYSSSRSFAGEVGWVDFELNQAFPVKDPSNAGSSLIVEISYTCEVQGYEQFAVSFLCSQSTNTIRSRGVYLNANVPLVEGKDLYWDHTSATQVPPTSVIRQLRPFIKFTYKATAANTQKAIYSQNSSLLCAGDPLTVSISNFYGTGLELQWQEKDLIMDNYMSLPSETSATYSTVQPVVDRILRCNLILPGGGFGSATENMTLRGVNKYEGGVWRDGPPAVGTSAYFASNANIGSMNLCSIFIKPGKTVNVESGATLTLDRKITSLGANGNGTLLFKNNATLLQNNDQQNDINNIQYQRNTTAMNRYDFTYYSSPVHGATIGSVSPHTLWDKYYEYVPATGWRVLDSSYVMKPGVGYAIRAPQNYAISGNAQIFTAKFSGKPANGNVPVLASAAAGGYNLIGNPYPSAVDAAIFLTENSSTLDGTVYFWKHEHGYSSTPDANGQYGYSGENYVSVNFSGSTDGETTLEVPSGQSFMVKTKTGGGPGEVMWKNSHRIGDQSGVQFYKVGNDKNELQRPSSPAGRIWLELLGQQGVYQRMLVGYVAGATEAYDNGYDAEHMQAGSLGFYAIANDESHLGIMAKGMPFTHESIIPIGFSAATAGPLTISKFHQHGFFEDYVVYLNDKLTNTSHNLSESSYTFTSAVGTFNNRFIIAFKPKTQVVINPNVKPYSVVLIDKAEALQLYSNADAIKNVIVYDITGRVIARASNCNSVEVALSKVPRTNQLIVVEIQLENGIVETQKFQF